MEGERVVQPVGQNNTCATDATPAIIPASVLYELLYQELVAARRSLLRGLEQVDKALDVVKAQSKQ